MLIASKRIPTRGTAWRRRCCAAPATLELDWRRAQKSRFDAVDSTAGAVGVFLPRGSVAARRRRAGRARTARWSRASPRPSRCWRARARARHAARPAARRLPPRQPPRARSRSAPDHLQLEPDHVLDDMLRALRLIVEHGEAAVRARRRRLRAKLAGRTCTGHDAQPRSRARPRSRRSRSRSRSRSRPRPHGAASAHATTVHRRARGAARRAAAADALARRPCRSAASPTRRASRRRSTRRWCTTRRSAPPGSRDQLARGRSRAASAPLLPRRRGLAARRRRRSRSAERAACWRPARRAELRQPSRADGPLAARSWLRQCAIRASRASPTLAALRPRRRWPVAFALAGDRSRRAAARGAARLSLSAGPRTMVQAALKAVPLGQSAGQRMLAGARDAIPAAVDARARRSIDDDARPSRRCSRSSSARHETQYSRLFRS